MRRGRESSSLGPLRRGRQRRVRRATLECPGRNANPLREASVSCLAPCSLWSWCGGDVGLRVGVAPCRDDHRVGACLSKLRCFATSTAQIFWPSERFSVMKSAWESWAKSFLPSSLGAVQPPASSSSEPPQHVQTPLPVDRLCFAPAFRQRPLLLSRAGPHQPGSSSELPQSGTRSR